MRIEVALWEARNKHVTTTNQMPTAFYLGHAEWELFSKYVIENGIPFIENKLGTQKTEFAGIPVYHVDKDHHFRVA